MKKVILNFTGNDGKKSHKLESKKDVLNKAKKDGDFIIEDDDIRILADVVSKNKSRISDMYIVVIGNNGFNTSKIRYKKALKLNDEEALVELCDSELVEKDEQIDQMRKEIEALKKENNELKSKVDSMTQVIKSQKEASKQSVDSQEQQSEQNQNPNSYQNQYQFSQRRNNLQPDLQSIPVKSDLIFKIDQNIEELYEGEIKHIILNILKNEAKKGDKVTSRKNDIINNILSNNYDPRGYENVLETFIFSLNDDGSLSATGIKDLTRIGFDIVRGGNNHTKIKLGNGRYIMVLGSTLSDKRSRENAISIFKNVFLCT